MIRTLDEIVAKRDEAEKSFALLYERRSEIMLEKMQFDNDSEENKNLNRELIVILRRMNDLTNIKNALNYLINYDATLDVSTDYIYKEESGNHIKKSLTTKY